MLVTLRLLTGFTRALALAVLFLMLTKSLALAQTDPEVIWFHGGSLDVSAAMRVHLEDDGEALNADRVLAESEQPRAQNQRFWLENKKTWGYQDRAVWLKLKLGNPGVEAQRVALVSPYFAPMWLQIHIYDEAGRLLRKVENGTMSPYEGRDLKLNRMGAYIDLPPQQIRVILLKHSTLALLDTHYMVRSLEEHQRFEWIYLGVYGLYFGLALALFFHNLSLFFSVRDPVYITYLIFVLVITLVIAFTSGFYGLLWGSVSPSMQNLVMVFPGLASVAGAYLAYSFLQLDYKTSTFGKLLLAFGLFGLICAPIQFFWPTIGVSFISVQSLGVAVLGVSACIAEIRKGKRFAALLLIAVSCPVLTIIVYIVGGTIFKVNVPSDIISMGFAAEMLLMSICLSHRIYSLKQEQHKMSAQQAAQMHASKMRAVNDLAGAVAHEVNNPLMIIYGYAEIIADLSEQPVDKGPIIRRNSLKIIQTVERIAFIVRSIRSISDDSLAHSHEIHVIQEIVAQALVLVRARVESHDIRLELQVSAEDVAIKGQAAVLLQVIFALINNSIEALANNAVKMIKIEVCSPWGTRRDCVAIIISDNGPGISRQDQEKLFQPFFTTKKLSEGIGLSLSYGRQIIEEHGGKLYLDTKAEMTSFVIELPAFSQSNLQSAEPFEKAAS
jgi:signal transduction histidine kinase